VIELGAGAHDAGIEGGKEKKEGLEKGGSPAGGAVEDDIRGELLERFEGFKRHPLILEVFVYVYDYV